MEGALVLVVDDDPAIRETLLGVLGDEGFRTIAAVDGADALALLQRLDELPDVILLDMMMPNMDGLAFRAAQRADPRLASIPALVLTANTTMARANNGSERFLEKPIALDHLLDAIAACTSART